MPIGVNDICKAMHNLGRLEALLDLHKFETEDTRNVFYATLSDLRDFVSKVRDESCQ